MISRCISRFGFTKKAVAQKTFLKLNECYASNVEDFKKNIKCEQSS